MDTTMTNNDPSNHAPQTPPPRPLLLALAGPTSSGKTTLATALSLIFSPSSSSSTTASPSNQPTLNPLTIIHADDFYLPDSRIPTLRDGTQDWDCPEALDVTRFHAVLTDIRNNGGVVPKDLIRQGGVEDVVRENLPDGIHTIPASRSPISPHLITSLRQHITQTWAPSTLNPPIILIEGIFLFCPPNIPSPLTPLNPLYDIRILLRSTRLAAKRRREARNGYVTLEGFWQDPPGYFDRVVWPGFERVYGGFMKGGDVEGRVDEGVVGGEGGVLVGPLLGDGDGDGDDREIRDGGGHEDGGKGQGGGGLEGVLEWIVEVLGRELGSLEDFDGVH